MNSATTDQAESMYKTIESMRQNLEKYDDIDMENIVVDGHSYNINETIESWIKKIYISKDMGEATKVAGVSPIYDPPLEGGVSFAYVQG